MIDATIRATRDHWPVFRADPRTGRLSRGVYYRTSPWFARVAITRVTWRDRERLQIGGYYRRAHGGIVCGDACDVTLRMHDADAIGRGRVSGYYGNPEAACDIFRPIIARLPRGRGFLAGWRMGECFALDYAAIHLTESDATYAAHELARVAAERETERYERVPCPTCGDARHECETCHGAGTVARWEIEE